MSWVVYDPTDEKMAAEFELEWQIALAQALEKWGNEEFPKIIEEFLAKSDGDNRPYTTDDGCMIEMSRYVCGEDFCELCGDCMACYGADVCYGDPEKPGYHVWIPQEDDRPYTTDDDYMIEMSRYE